ncbi:MAG: branched-chain amino acid transaminase [Candidatus Eremiobacteraeota bacterium]|nr:branched-chain amino acid transaminase [Candidatus Eremiobacteraeota bacterium]
MPSVPLQHMEIAPYYWFDGVISPKEAVTVDPFAHGLHYGTGVFEGVRAYATPRGPAIFRLREHMERFARSAEIYSLKLDWDVPTLCDAIVEVLLLNELQSAYIRPLAFFGQKTISLAPTFYCPTHVLIANRALGNYFGAGQEDGIRVTISPWRKFSSKALPSTVKASGHYANSVLAMTDAVRRGFDEAILLNDRGEVAEGTGENIFLVKNGRLRTNDRSADVLHGITRASVIQLAHDRDIPVEICPLTVDDLHDADEVFFTGTAAEVTPLACIDEHVFSNDRPITFALRDAYLAAVTGDDPRHADWVTFANEQPAPRTASPVKVAAQV